MRFHLREVRTDAGMQLSLDAKVEEFFVIVSDELTVYEDYDTSVAEVQKIPTETDSFLTEVSIDN